MLLTILTAFVTQMNQNIINSINKLTLIDIHTNMCRSGQQQGVNMSSCLYLCLDNGAQ